MSRQKATPIDYAVDITWQCPCGAELNLYGSAIPETKKLLKTCKSCKLKLEIDPVEIYVGPIREGVTDRWPESDDEAKLLKTLRGYGYSTEQINHALSTMTHTNDVDFSQLLKNALKVIDSE